MVDALWPVREHALALDNVAATDQIEDGVAREFDDAVSVDDRARPSRPGLRRVRSHGQVVVFVARQVSYPASFLAEVVTSEYATDRLTGSVAGAPYVELLLMTRSDRATTWKLTLDTGYGGSTPETPPTPDAEGFEAEPPTSFLDPGQLHAKLADYWQHWKDTGAGPPDATLWRPGYWTTQRSQLIAAQRNGAPPAACGCVGEVRYSAQPAVDGFWSFAVNESTGGRPRRLVCSTVRIHEQLMPVGPTSVLVQDQHRNNWGGWLAPGPYSSITNDLVRQSCISAGTIREEGLGVVGGNGDLVKVRGTRAGALRVLRGGRVTIGAATLLAVVAAVALVLAGAGGGTYLVWRRRRPGPWGLSPLGPSWFPPAGWYPDPTEAGGRLRWWDGTRWADHTRPG